MINTPKNIDERNCRKIMLVTKVNNSSQILQIFSKTFKKNLSFQNILSGFSSFYALVKNIRFKKYIFDF